VLDPFCGSGSTGVAARDEGFKFLGLEREPAYVEIARKRTQWAREAEAQQEATDEQT
jgi:site-specific DNA-methyltransferase (adenine-specific)